MPLNPGVVLPKDMDPREYARWCRQQDVTANSSDAFLLDRANHTGTQVRATISDFPDTVSQAEAEAGIATTDRIWTAQRVKQAIVALGGTGNVDESLPYFLSA